MVFPGMIWAVRQVSTDCCWFIRRISCKDVYKMFLSVWNI